jgi:uncharacterized protein (DUF849 family)
LEIAPATSGIKQPVPPLLEAALNGSRSRAEHPAVPRTPGELATEARAAVDEGAKVVHLHPYSAEGAETLEAEPCAAAIRAVRAACPGVPVSLSTSAGIEPEPRRRLELVASWTELPDLVTANQDETGILELCEHLIARGVGIEAGLSSASEAEAFVGSTIAERCVRGLVEPLEASADRAMANAAAIEEVLLGAVESLEQIHHGDGLASWAVNARGLRRGHGIRTGIEDTTVMPDARPADGNGALVRAAAEMIAQSA